ncbi:unnamed protein product, partial [Mesorhabditis belari]|uniref:Branchpoint-bridging protein n=1 Tax=Mesorhabditis belari TaxID=2138241 RepID=A0AAF3ER97_9BILA
MGKTGGNMEPMPFVRKFGSAAATEGDPNEQDDGPVTAAPPPNMDESSSRRERKKDRKRSRSREKKEKRSKRSRSRSRDRRSRSRERKRSRSRDRRDRRRSSQSPTDLKPDIKPDFKASTPPPSQMPIINPLVREDLLEEAAEKPELAVALIRPARERKSRWSTQKSFVPGMPTILPANLTDEQREAYLLQLDVEEATRKLRLGDFGDPNNRSPSPEPIYDSNGKRLNTRDVRKRQEVEIFRHTKIQRLLQINPNYKPPADYRAPNIRLNDRVWIPQDENPHINFVGLLIGPRGSTLKTLEAETGCKIIIRGKGSIKEGKLAGRMGPLPGENEPLHAYVTGNDLNLIKGACERIRSIIEEAIMGGPIGGPNDLRALQLRELAMMNGTFRPEDFLGGNRCSNCGSEEHKTWECPNAPNMTAKIVCTACGSAGHLTRDCRNPRPGWETAAGAAAGMDDEYSALMAELEGGQGGANGDAARGATAARARGTATRGVFNRPGLSYQGPGRGGFGGGFMPPPGGFPPPHGGFPPPFFPPPGGDMGYNSFASMGGPPPPPPPSGAGADFAPNVVSSRDRGYYGGGGGYGYGGHSHPLPVPPPPPPAGVSAFAPPPPPPPVPQPDLSSLLKSAPPPPPPQ